MTEFTKVAEAEFNAFVTGYGKPLERNVSTIYEPPLVTFNDFERAPYWPDSVVARYFSGDNGPEDFAILSDVGSPVPDDGKRDTDNPILSDRGEVVREGDTIWLHWGGGIRADGTQSETFRSHVVVVRDKGTKYERLSLHDCHNSLRSFDGRIILVKRGAAE